MLLVIDENAENSRLDAYLAELYDGISRSKIQSAIKSGKVTVNGVVKKASYSLKEGDKIEFENLVRKRSRVHRSKIEEYLRLVFQESEDNIFELITAQNVDKKYFDVYHIFQIQTNRRNELKDYLLDNGIKTEIHYPIAPINQEGYKEIFNEQKGKTEIAEKLANSVLSLPISFGTTEDEVKYVIDVMNKF